MVNFLSKISWSSSQINVRISKDIVLFVVSSLFLYVWPQSCPVWDQVCDYESIKRRRPIGRGGPKQPLISVRCNLILFLWRTPTWVLCQSRIGTGVWRWRFLAPKCGSVAQKAFWAKPAWICNEFLSHDNSCKQLFSCHFWGILEFGWWVSRFYFS